MALASRLLSVIGPQHLRDVEYATDIPIAPPYKVVFLMTNRCPLRCVMCWTHTADRHHERSFDDWAAALDQAAEWGVQELMFSGGEPLLRLDDVVRLTRRGHNRGMKMACITSGYTMNEDVAARLHGAGLNVLMTSIDGPTAATHNRIRGLPESFNRVLLTLNLGRDFSRVHRLRQFPGEHLEFSSGVMATIQRGNIGGLLDIYHVARDAGADFVCFQAVTYFGGTEEQWPTPEQWPALDREVDTLLGMQAQGAPLGVSASFLAAIPKYFRDPASVTDRQCQAGFSDLIITAQGGVSTCFSEVHDDNPATIDLKSLWRHKRMQDIRQRIKACDKPCFLACWNDSLR